MKTDDLTIYLDYAAATPIDPKVRIAMEPYLSEEFYNPSAPYGAARKVRAAVDMARTRVAALMGARASNIVFTAGATEATNLAFTAISADAHVVSSAIEHESVLACVEAFAHSLVPVDAQGIVGEQDVAAAITPETELVSLSLANGELGSVQPLRKIARLVAAERMRRLEAGEKRPIYLHTDATQAPGAISVSTSTVGADLMTLSAAKMYGPKQVGLLWAADGIALHPLVRGGGQESGLRSGTENVAGIVGFARAFELAAERRASEAARLEALRERMAASVLAQIPFARVLGPAKAKRRLPQILPLCFPGLLGRRLVIALDARGVAVGTGSACAASKMRVSRALLAIGLDERQAQGTIRVSFGAPTTEQDVDAAAAAIVDAVRAEALREGLL